LALKQTVAPYLLRRLKKDVATHLPVKTEQVLMCNLTDVQRQAYSDLLDRDDVRAMLSNDASTKTGALFKIIISLQKA